MVIEEKYYGTAEASITGSSANAYTAFGSSAVKTHVSGTYRYKIATGGYGIMNKSSNGVQTCSVSFAHKNAYSIISNHSADATGYRGTSTSIEVIY